jgi:hypothetical protein
MSWYLIYRETCDIVLWTPIDFGCLDGNEQAITLVSFGGVDVNGFEDLVLDWNVMLIGKHYFSFSGA